MDALIIKKKYLDLILEGKKTWELRGSKTTKRGQIAFIESGSGLIIGFGELVDCHGPLAKESLIQNFEKTQYDPNNSMIKYKNTFAWEIKNAQRLKEPVKYKHPQGAIIWVKVDFSPEVS